MNKLKFSKVEMNESFKMLLGSGEQGDIMQPHISNKDAYLMVTEGTIQFSIEGKISIIGKHEGIPIPKDKVHSFKVIDSCHLLLTLDANAQVQFV